MALAYEEEKRVAKREKLMARHQTAESFVSYIEQTQITEAFKQIVDEALQTRPEGVDVFNFVARRLREIGAFRRRERLHQLKNVLPTPGADGHVSIRPAPGMTHRKRRIKTATPPLEVSDADAGLSSARSTSSTTAAKKLSRQFQELGGEISEAINDPEGMTGLWEKFDPGGTGSTKLSSVVGLIRDVYPLLNSESAALKAYTRVTDTAAASVDTAVVAKDSLALLLEAMVFYNQFESVFGTAEQPALFYTQFKAALRKFDISTKRDDDVKKWFAEAAPAGDNKTITFTQFADWLYLHKHR
mmetsp:Transcript_46617/g.91711  ORF Transcript_46617/g.91711 Transcript_46617/m.91711 type:complete len:301 (+) Transcript_46617:85-987(+)